MWEFSAFPYHRSRFQILRRFCRYFRKALTCLLDTWYLDTRVENERMMKIAMFLHQTLSVVVTLKANISLRVRLDKLYSTLSMFSYPQSFLLTCRMISCVYHLREKFYGDFQFVGVNFVDLLMSFNNKWDKLSHKSASMWFAGWRWNSILIKLVAVDVIVFPSQSVESILPMSCVWIFRVN